MKPVHILIMVIVFAGSVFAYNYVYQSAIDEALHAPITPSEVNTEKHRPDFTMTDVDGLPRQVSEWDGKPLVINFWASWCEPCRREIPDFIDVQRQFQNDGLQLLGIALEERQTVRDYMDGMAIPFNYPILVGTDEAVEVARSYGNDMGILPFTVAIDRHGNIIQLQYGEFRRKDIDVLMKKLLDAPSSRQ